MANVKILFEDNHMLVAVKPGGLLTQPTELEADCLVARLKKQAGLKFLEPIHRLDKVSSGIVVLAKSSKALSRMMKSLRERTCSKAYLALTDKKPTETKAVLKHSLLREDFKTKPGAQGKEARLSYEVLGKKGPYYLISIDLDTGRYHQIRAQLSAIGCPIVGDAKYGSSKPFKKGAIALHHKTMSLPHPISGEIKTFTAPACFE